MHQASSLSLSVQWFIVSHKSYDNTHYNSSEWMPKRREHNILNDTLSHSSILTTYNISSQFM